MGACSFVWPHLTLLGEIFSWYVSTIFWSGYFTRFYRMIWKLPPFHLVWPRIWLILVVVDEVELLTLTIDKELNFSKHTDKLCHNAQYKLHALRRIRKNLSLEKAKMLGNAFTDSRFNYAPLICMFCRKGLYLKMQMIHHKTLKVIYQPNKTYEELF